MMGKLPYVRMRQCSSVYFIDVVGTCSLEHWQEVPELTYRIWISHGNYRFDRRRAMPHSMRAQRRSMGMAWLNFSF